MVYLVDVNVLIARRDADHEHHRLAAQWWNRNLVQGWATCPITENGVIRILGRPSYPGWLGSPDRAGTALRQLIGALPGHHFFADDISSLDAQHFSGLAEVSPSQVTDLYLLALAVHHKAKFVSLDKRIPARLIPGGTEAYVAIE